MVLLHCSFNWYFSNSDIEIIIHTISLVKIHPSLSDKSQRLQPCETCMQFTRSENLLGTIWPIKESPASSSYLLLL